jgi:hypothetical protein
MQYNIAAMEAQGYGHKQEHIFLPSTTVGRLSKNIVKIGHWGTKRLLVYEGAPIT